MKKNRDGKYDLDPDEFSPLYARALISIKIPLDTLDRYPEEEERRWTKYETPMNKVSQDSGLGFSTGNKVDPVLEVVRRMKKGASLAKVMRAKVSKGKSRPQ